MEQGSSEPTEGLADVVATRTELCEIDGDRGALTIRGFPVETLAREGTFEEALYLLWYGELPTADRLERFAADLSAAWTLPDTTVRLLTDLAAARVSVMDALEMGIATAGIDTVAGGDDRPSAVAESTIAVARLPSIVATYWRLLDGAEPVDPRPGLSHAENYLYTLTGKTPDEARVNALETYLTIAIEHGLNASSFAARVIVSTESDVLSGITAAVGAFKGARHGGAPALVARMLAEARAHDDIGAYLRTTLDAGGRLPGFGHRVYRVRDPRATILAASAEAFYETAADRAFYEFALAFEREATALLAERHPGAALRTNVEFYAALLFQGLSLPTPLYTPTFAVSRVGGWTAHCQEQRRSDRIIRPRAAYVGERDRRWVPAERR